MSWFRSLRDDFTLTPLEDQHTRDSAAMATGSAEVTASAESAEVQDECSGKKKSKFQMFKKFFSRKKRKELSAGGEEASLRASQSSDNVSRTSENNTLTRSETEKGSGSKVSLGGKALSHDSVFVSDSSEANEALGASQDSIHGKVKSMQHQLKNAINLGSPPSLMCVKKTEDAEAMSEDNGLLHSPPEYTGRHTVLNKSPRHSVSLEGVNSDDDQVSCAASSRAMSPLAVPGDFSQPASPFVCLDNSAAKHKLGLRQKACNKRKPARRLEAKPEEESVVETLKTRAEDEALKEQEQQRREDLADELTPNTEKEEEEEEEADEEKEQQSLLRDNEERQDECEDVQDVSHEPDTSCHPQRSLSEEDASESQPPPSSLDTSRTTPEPPAGPTADASIPKGLEENEDGSDSSLSGREDQVEKNGEEEGSLLQEVLSSLKTPLTSRLLDPETEVRTLERREEVEEENKLEVQVEGEEEEHEEEEEEEEADGHQAVPACPLLSSQTSKEREDEDVVVTASCQEEEDDAGEEEVEGGEHESEEEEESSAVESFVPHGSEEEDKKVMEEMAEEVKPNETINQAGENEEEEEESEGAEEAIELEKEPEPEEKGGEKREEDEDRAVVESKAVEEAEEALEEDIEEAVDEFSGAQEEQVQSAIAVQEADEGVTPVKEDVYTTQHSNRDKIPVEAGTEVHPLVQDTGEEREDGGERVEEGVELSAAEQKSDQAEENVEANGAYTDQSEQNLENHGVEMMPHEDKDSSANTEQAVSPELFLPETKAVTPRKSSASIIHVNLVSPNSDRNISLLQLPPLDVDSVKDLSQWVVESASPDVESPQLKTKSMEEAYAETVKGEEEEEQPTQEEEAVPQSVEETFDQPPSSMDQTIAPAWQRSHSLILPASPPACISSSSPARVTAEDKEDEEDEEDAATTKEDQTIKPEPVSSPKVELVLSPTRVRNAVSVASKPQRDAAPALVKLQSPAAASPEGSSVIAEGNPSNPFGVQLRRTSGLLRFSSEEQNTEASVESSVQSASSKVDSPQNMKLSVCQPVSIKPALPKKPEVHGDSAGKLKHLSDPAGGRAVAAGSDPPSWISLAQQKQKIYKESSVEEITVKKEELERKTSLPAYVSSAVDKEHKTAAVNRPSQPSVEMEVRRPLSPPSPVPPQPPKSLHLPSPVTPKPQIAPTTMKYPPQRTPSIPTPIPFSRKSPPCPSSPSKTVTSPMTHAVTSPPFLSRTTSESSALRAPGPSSQSGSGSPTLPQNEPPWMALAKKKAKAWSEMPQIVQ
ncbi:uncharacterized protein KZ484_009242 isoform 2-T2 [Pholidichthys leucotaenia]